MSTKTFLISAASFVLLVSTMPVFATSGACSWHGGVNCNLQTTDGYAVCNDGFVSSIPYSQMDECSAASCLMPSDISQLNQSLESIANMQIQSLQSLEQTEINQQNQVNQENMGQVRSGLAATGRLGTTGGEGAMATAAQAGQDEINNITSRFNAQIAQINAALYGEEAANKLKQCSTAPQTQIQLNIPSVSNGFIIGGQLYCSVGYVNYNGNCVDENKLAKDMCYAATQFSGTTGSLGSDGTLTCTCDAGYIWNSLTNGCDALSSVGTEVINSVSTSTIKASSLVSITQNLKIGDTGQNVINLQRFLETKGFLTMPYGTTEGYFGSFTKQALIAFQKLIGLPATGYCGAMTRTAISNQQ